MAFGMCALLLFICRQAGLVNIGLAWGYIGFMLLLFILSTSPSGSDHLLCWFDIKFHAPRHNQLCWLGGRSNLAVGVMLRTCAW
jgi:hypothetical protein